MIYLSGMASIVPLLLLSRPRPRQPNRPANPVRGSPCSTASRWTPGASSSPKGAEAVRAGGRRQELLGLIKDGALWKDGNANDIASKEQFGDFELEIEWKIGKAGNSGMFYRGTEDAQRHLLERAGVPAARQHRTRPTTSRTTTSPGRSTTCMPSRRTPPSRRASGTRRGSSRKGITSSTG